MTYRNKPYTMTKVSLGECCEIMMILLYINSKFHLVKLALFVSLGIVKLVQS